MKTMIYIGMTIGSLLGSYIPVLFFKTDFLSYSSILGSGVGGLVGVWAGYKIGQNL